MSCITFLQMCESLWYARQIISKTINQAVFRTKHTTNEENMIITVVITPLKRIKQKQNMHLVPY